MFKLRLLLRYGCDLSVLYGTNYNHIPALLRLQDQVPLVSLVSLTMVAMKYCLSMCLTVLMLYTLEIISLLQRALPSSLAGCTTFWQTQVCACVCMYEVPVCVPVNVWVGRQTCVHTCVHVCVYLSVRVHACQSVMRTFNYHYMHQNCTCTLYLQVLLLLLHFAQLSHLPSHFPPNGHLESLIQVHILFYVYLHCLMRHCFAVNCFAHIFVSSLYINAYIYIYIYINTPYYLLTCKIHIS